MGIRAKFLILIFGILFLAGSVQGMPQWFDPANQVHIVLTPSATFLAEGGEFSFSYALESKPDSQQFVENFILTLPMPTLTGVKQILSPPNTQWKAMKHHQRHYSPKFVPPQSIGWFPDNGPSDDPNFFNLPAQDTIKPGEKLSGFTVIARNLPGIRFFWIKGFVPHIPSERAVLDYINSRNGTNFTNGDEIPYKLLITIPQFQPTHLNAVSGKTVGPDILPENLTNEQLLDRLVQLKEEAFQLGWINDQVIANNLGEKLKGVKEKVQAGQAAVAANILHAFIHDLEAQHREGEEVTQANKDKHINDNAFYLLKPNAEFILWKLSAK